MNQSDDIAEILGRWYDARDGERPIDPEDLIRDHPEIADELRDHFRLLDVVGASLASDAVDTGCALPDRLGPFRILDTLGSGGMGTVYLAEVEEEVDGLAPGEPLALKVMHPHLLAAPGFYRRFVREAAIGFELRHENVVRTHTAGSLEQDGRRLQYLAMEYVEGQTLADLVHELGRVPEELARHVGVEIAHGLEAIHAAGAVHRDLKPENVMITEDHRVKVMDLGVAWLADELVQLSHSGQFVGSLAYAAPEQIRGAVGRADPRVDLHALGVILHELVTGVNPFRRDEIGATLKAIVDEAPPRAAAAEPAISPFFEEVLLTLLAKQPGERFPDASTLIEALHQAESGPWWQARSRDRVAGGVAAVLPIRVSRQTPLLGREKELDTLEGLFESARGGHGRVALLEGEAGIGKTRLAARFVEALRERGEDPHVLYAACPPGPVVSASSPWVDALRAHLEGRAIADVVNEWLQDVSGLAPAFAALIEGVPLPEGAQPLPADGMRTCVSQAIRALAAERPTIVVVDDLHDAAAEDVALFAALARTSERHRFLLLGTSRRRPDAGWWLDVERRCKGVCLRLPRLGAKHLTQLVADALGSRRRLQEAAYLIAAKSDGNPFFALEILDALKASGALRSRRDGSWDTSGVDLDVEVPSTIEYLIQARLAGLDSGDRDLLDVAACEGVAFDGKLVGDVLGLRPIDALRRLAVLERDHHLVRAEGRVFVFDHQLVREVLLDGLSEPLRETYHAAIADALERAEGARGQDPERLEGELCVRLFDQHLRGGNGASAHRYLLAAVRHLIDQHRTGEIVELTDRALRVPGLLEGQARFDMLHVQCDRLFLQGRIEQQQVLHEEMRRLAESLGPEARMQAARLAGTLLTYSGHYDEAQIEHERHRVIALEHGSRFDELVATGNLGLIEHQRQNFPEARSLLGRSLELARELDAHGEVGGALANLGGLAYLEGRYDEAEGLLRECLEHAQAHGLLRIEAKASSNLSNLLALLKPGPEAESLRQHELELVQRIGDRRQECETWCNIGCGHTLAGRFGEATRELEASLDLAREMGDPRSEAVAVYELGVVAQLQEQEELAARRLDEAVVLARGAEWPALCVLALCRRSRLPGADVPEAVEAYRTQGHLVPPHKRVEALYSLYLASEDVELIREAHNELEQLASQVPEAQRGQFLDQGLHRKVRESFAAATARNSPRS